MDGMLHLKVIWSFAWPTIKFVLVLMVAFAFIGLGTAFPAVSAWIVGIVGAIVFLGLLGLVYYDRLTDMRDLDNG